MILVACERRRSYLDMMEPVIVVLWLITVVRTKYLIYIGADLYVGHFPAGKCESGVCLAPFAVLRHPRSTYFEVQVI
jgi:hypothetical protein